jgi:hypothetical protein
MPSVKLVERDAHLMRSFGCGPEAGHEKYAVGVDVVAEKPLQDVSSPWALWGLYADKRECVGS